MSRFRFVHAADIHLDSPLRGLSRQEGAAAERIRAAPREAFVALIDHCLDIGAAFLLIAGDLFDGDWPDTRTGLFFAHQMGRLDRAGLPVFIVHGNHDAASSLTRDLPLPDGVVRFAANRPETREIPALGVALHGQSFATQAETRDLAAGYPPPVPGRVNIGLLHTGLGGMEGHANYAPCALSDLVAKGYDYWALGHVHRGAVLHRHPHVVFPGVLQGRHIRETGPKGACVVTVEDGTITACDPLVLDRLRWAWIAVDVTDCETLPAATDRLRAAVAREAETSDGRLLACRLALTGRTPLHDRLVLRAEDLRDELRAVVALDLGEDAAWIDKVLVETTPPAEAADHRAREDALGRLLRSLEDAPEDPALADLVRREIRPLLTRLPADLKDTLATEGEDPLLAAALADDMPRLIAEAGAFLAARLEVAGDGSEPPSDGSA